MLVMGGNGWRRLVAAASGVDDQATVVVERWRASVNKCGGYVEMEWSS